MDKTVYSNDLLNFNFEVSKALIENNNVKISDKDFKEIITRKDNFSYDFFIKDNFNDIYFLYEENEWLDIVVQNIYHIKNQYKRAMFFWALFQACLSKRPYNLFHRKKLYIRTAEVERKFGNKATWEKPFEEHFYKFIQEINNAFF